MKRFSDISSPVKNSSLSETLNTGEGRLGQAKKSFLADRFWYLKAVLILIGAAALWLLVSFYGGNFSNFPAIDRNKTQAVSINNGLTYFGHLEELNKSYVTLKDVYYLKTGSAQQQNNTSLVKLSNEIYGPEDITYFPKAQILFWQNMRADSQVVRLINQAEGKK